MKIEWSKRRKAHGIYEITGRCGRIVRTHTLMLTTHDKPTASEVEMAKGLIAGQIMQAAD